MAVFFKAAYRINDIKRKKEIGSTKLTIAKQFEFNSAIMKRKIIINIRQIMANVNVQ